MQLEWVRRIERPATALLIAAAVCSRALDAWIPPVATPDAIRAYQDADGQDAKKREGARPLAAKRGDRSPRGEVGPAKEGETRRVVICSSALHVRPGRPGPDGRTAQRIRARYRAVPLSEATLETIAENDRARAFLNARVLRRLIQFSTDVPLRFGARPLPVGTYDAGFQCVGVDRWRFVIVNRRDEPLVDTEIRTGTGETEIPRLNLSIVPGAKTGQFWIAIRYGKRRAMIRGTWTVP